ncbi:MAG: ABC transporter ATP-binding protein [Actinomycetota bacterium]|nr:ABC transporter ATP-binding protein [Actinomycetota bacterium]
MAAVTAPAVGGPDQVEPAVLAQSLYRFFRSGEEETLALQGVALSVAPGELVAVVGPSGSGKSTLLACLAGLDEPDGGSVMVAGQAMSHQPERLRTSLRAGCIGWLGQSGNLFEHLTVRGNLRFARAMVPTPATRDHEELLATVGLTERADAYPSELSGGELARAGLAVALANDPAVLLADEPTGELDSASESRVVDLLAVAAHNGAAVLVASHSPAVAARADRVIRLDDGKVTA